jgi:septal ring factor EnvC (AmiA/AmiB activator)
MVKITIKIFWLLVCLSTLLLSQTNNQIKSKSSELDKLQQDIQMLEAELLSKTAKEKKSYQSLQKIDNQNLLINKLINRLKKEESRTSKDINKINIELTALEDTIKNLRADYSKYILWVYKHGENSILKYLLNSESIGQAMLRYKYLSYITDKNEAALDRLNASINKSIELKNKLINEISKKENIVKKKRNEQRVLTKKKTEKESIINKIKEDKNLLAKEISEKRKAEIKIKELISKLIEEEIRRREEMAKNNSGSSANYKYDYTNLKNFNGLKGKLNWPVSAGIIIRKFGKNKNSRLNTVTLNYGVDIQTKKQTEVFAVAEGIVSAIEWIPGFGSVLIVTHKDNFRTVYGHIKDIGVIEGQKVSAGGYLGRVNESLEGNILHFEIWNQRDFQNPETWLVKK